MRSRYTQDHLKLVQEYYDQCWLKRFEAGHNPISLAMHLGYFNGAHQSNDKAKVRSNEYLVSYLGLPANEPVSILDIGCGVGGTCIYISSHFPDANITGVNLSPTQVKFAEQSIKKRGGKHNIQFLVSDYADTGLDAASFDFIYGVESVCHAQDKRAVFQECFRLLKAGGIYCMMDYFEIRDPVNSHESNLLDQFREGWVVPEYIRNFKHNLEEAGFSNVESRSLLENVRTGISLSYDKATHALEASANDHINTLYKHHLEACQSLKELVNAGIIDYRIIKCSKP